MGNTVYKPDKAGITKLLQSEDMKALTEKYARGRGGSDADMKSFIGFDRAKTIIYSSNKES